MNFIILSFGSKGDINPFIHIGKALLERGHKVTIVTNEFYKTEIEKAGIGFYQVGTTEEYLRFTQSPELFHPTKAFDFVLKNFVLKNMAASYDAIKNLFNSETTLIAQSIVPAARIAHETLNIPLISINLQPVSFWSVYKPPLFSGMPPGIRKLPFKVRKFLLTTINKFVIDKQFASGINPFLKELNLSAQNKFFSRWLYSPQLVLGLFPEWFAKPAQDWVANVKLVGFTQEIKDERLSDELEAFLSHGKSPIIFTAGSAMQNANYFFQVANQVIINENERAVFICSDVNLKNIILGKNIFVTNYAAFDKLFQKSKMIVHHGGIGTIIPAIMVGKPQIIVPFAHDQPDNADRIETLGLGVSIQPQKLTVSRLTERINELKSSDKIENNCLHYSKQINPSKTINEITKTIENFSKSHTAPISK